MEDGTVRCWGDYYGTVPTDTFYSIDASYHQTCGITTSGELKCWGDDQYDVSNHDNDSVDVLNDCDDHDPTVGPAVNGVCL